MASPVEIWYAALHSERGIVVSADNRDKLRSALYSERRALADPALEEISIFLSPTVPNELWLVKNPNPQKGTPSNAIRPQSGGADRES